jgi:hypothetical protein
MHVKKQGIVVMPEVQDYPGSNYSYIWDYFVNSRVTLINRVFQAESYALVIVFSAVQTNGIELGSRNKEPKVLGIDKIDNDYVNLQLGYAKMLGGAISAKTTQKPKVIIVFIAKFDLFSDDPPHETSSQNIKKDVEKIFERHVDALSSAANLQGIPCDVITGSSFKKWQVDNIVDHVVSRLYP